jgi:hypothetical protein
MTIKDNAALRSGERFFRGRNWREDMARWKAPEKTP